MKLILYCFRYRLNDGSRLLGVGTSDSRRDSVVINHQGIHSDGFKLMSQVISERLPDHPVGVLSGPNLAQESQSDT